MIVVPGGLLVADAWPALGASAEGNRKARIERSPNYAGGKFVNALPVVMDTWAATKRWLAGGPDREPEKKLEVDRPTAKVLAVPPASGLRITWFGHSSMLIELDGKKFLTDPVWSDRCSPTQFTGPRRFFDPPLPLDALPPLDAVVISHDHYDHLDSASIRQLSARTPLFLVPLGVGAHLESWGVAKEKIVELDWWERANIGDVTLVATPARHFSGRAVLDRDATLWASWAFLGPRHRAYFSGDTGMFPGFAEIGEKLGPFDVTMIESGAYDATWADVHLGPEQALSAHLQLRGKVMIPVHWGTFNLAVHSWVEPAERLIAAARPLGVSLAIPAPGESVEPAALPPLARWWPEGVQWEHAGQRPVISSGLDARLRASILTLGAQR